MADAASSIRFTLLAASLLTLRIAGQDSPAGDVRFNRDVRPILAENCLACHGPDAARRKASLRLDDADSAFAQREGGAAIVPGDPERSLLVARIMHDDPDERMPPATAKKTLTVAQIDVLTRWIAAGAEYEPHWSFVAPARPPVPDVPGATTAIDAFVSAARPVALTAVPEADRATLVRRVAFDLTGLPPAPADIRRFLEDGVPGAYERMVDRFLDSPHYAEHMARYWLDLARYADTNGYQYDRERQMWAWRDWVIRAYRENMPFDRFTIEQLAGDLLPDATTSQRVATGFNRNHPITIEGGVVDEEYRVEYVIDRVRTTATVWMGLTMGCARCHDHKYDPISQRDFYAMFAFFNQVPERGLNGFDPKLEVQSPESAEHAASIATEIERIERDASPGAAEFAAWEATLASAGGWRALGRLEDQELSVPVVSRPITALRFQRVPGAMPQAFVDPPPASVPVGRYVRVDLPGRTQYLSLAEVRVIAGGRNVARGRRATQSSTAYGGPPGHAVDGNTDGVFTRKSITHTAREREPWWEVDLGSDHGIERIEVWNRTDCCGDRLTGGRVIVLDATREPVFEYRFDTVPAPDVSLAVGGPRAIDLAAVRGVFALAEPLAVAAGNTLRVRADSDGAVECSDDPRFCELASLTPAITAILAIAPAERDAAQLRELAAFRLATDPDRVAIRSRLEELRAERQRILARGKTTVLVMRDRPTPRPTHVLERGQYDQPGERVAPGAPQVLPPLVGDVPRNRLGFARWLISPAHPLTARVAVNRYWQRLFGRGLVATPEDFGSRGAPPSHPELLDWLAAEFVHSGWDVKAMLRRIVRSATYRQSSRASPAVLTADPENRWLARAPRLRLGAESIRDQALALSGLLERRIGGPSVYPYQPPGLWLEINNRPGYSRAYPSPDRASAYRRSMYTYWKRTLPPPSMQLFDAPNREACTVARSRTSTPLQALVLLHDPQFVEAARAFGVRVLNESADRSDDGRIAFALGLATGRDASAAERAELARYLDEERARFAVDAAAAERALSIGLAPRAADVPVAEQAAWMSVARLILNLDEVIHRS